LISLEKNDYLITCENVTVTDSPHHISHESAQAIVDKMPAFEPAYGTESDPLVNETLEAWHFINA